MGGGTVIHPDPDIDAVSASQASSAANTATAQQWSYKPLAELIDGESPGLGSELPHPKLPTAVTIKEHIVVLNVNSNRKSVSHGFLAGIFGVLDRFGVVVDLISTSEVHVSMAIEDGIEKKTLDKVVKELKKYGTVSVLIGIGPCCSFRSELMRFCSTCRYPLTVTWPFSPLSGSKCGILWE